MRRGARGYFSIVQRKVLTPNQFVSLAAVEASLLGFQDHYTSVARPFEWRFTRKDLLNESSTPRSTPPG